MMVLTEGTCNFARAVENILTQSVPSILLFSSFEHPENNNSI